MSPPLNQQLIAARYKIDDLLRLVAEGKVRLPRFQRPLRWSGSDVERLFDSIYQGFPIGTLLFWIKEAPAEDIQLGPVEIRAGKLQEAHWVVDGQQRITSLVASLLPGNLDERDQRFEIVFDLLSEQFSHSAPHDPDTRIPVREAYDLHRVLTWMRDRDLPTELQDRAFQLADRLHNYEIPAYLVKTDDESALQIIFDRTNTFGKSMKKAEVFQALNSSAANPRADVRTVALDIASRGYGSLVGNTLLYCVLSTRGPDVLREFRNEFKTEDDQIDALQRTRDAVFRATDFLHDRADVPHLSLIPHQNLTVGLVRFFALHPTPQPQILVLLRRWFWRAAVMGPISKLGTTGTLRATTSAIAPGNEFQSVANLLDLTSGNPPTFNIGSYKWTSADNRIAVCGLAHLAPRDVLTGEPLDVTDLVDRLARDAMVPIVSLNRDAPLLKTIANRMFASPSIEMSESEFAAQLSSADASTLSSHRVDEEMVQALQDGGDDRFLEMRGASLTTYVNSFLEARMEQNMPTRPSISALLTDDD